MNQRPDKFLNGVICGSYNELWSFSKKVLLSHGQATVERGLSVNKEVESCNLKEDTVVEHMILCHGIRWCFECAFIIRVTESKSARSG